MAIVALAVLTDLPTAATRNVQISGDSAVVSAVNADVKSCAYAVKQSLAIYRDELRHLPIGSARSQVPGLLRDDQLACTFTNSAIFNLANIEVPSTSAGKYLRRLVPTMTTWATSDALLAIESIQKLWTRPSDARAQLALSTAERRLRDDRIIALADLAAAGKSLRTALPPLRLPALPS
ncbi:MAG: hypothetical protein ACYDGN_02100 [Acidimicrobiales bacterium]